jgi:HEPN domain-containing protein
VLNAQLCFHAQEAAEKALKAVLVCLDVSFPRTHDIAALAALLPDSVGVPPGLQRARQLTAYATQLRYPGAAEPVAEDERTAAVLVASQVVEWAERITSASGEEDSVQTHG